MLNEFFLQIVLFLLGLFTGIAVPLLPKHQQKLIAGILASLLIVFSLAWAGYAWLDKGIVSPGVQQTAMSSPTLTRSAPTGIATATLSAFIATAPLPKNSPTPAIPTLTIVPTGVTQRTATRTLTAPATPKPTADCVGLSDKSKHLLVFKPHCWKVIDPAIRGDTFKPTFPGGDVGGFEAKGIGNGTFTAGGLYMDRQQGLPYPAIEAIEMDLVLEKVTGSMYVLVQSGWSTKKGPAGIATGLGLNQATPSARLRWTPPPLDGQEIMPQDQLIASKDVHKLRVEWQTQQVVVFVDGQRKFTNITMPTDGYPDWFRINAAYFGSGEVSAIVGSVLVTCHP